MTQQDVEKQVAEAMKFLGNKEYQGKFLLTPDIQNEADFSHLDKNTAITNLRQRIKGEVDEVEIARHILRARHILNNPKYYKEGTVQKLVAHREVKQKDKSIVLIPVYQDVKVQVPIYQKTSHMLNSKYYSFVITASARNGHRIDKAIANRLEKEEKITDKTNIDGSSGSFRGRQR